jgi:predicted GIY-YIG superfamily endonuclease
MLLCDNYSLGASPPSASGSEAAWLAWFAGVSAPLASFAEIGACCCCGEHYGPYLAYRDIMLHTEMSGTPGTKASYVYCLVCSNGRTYVGATVDLDRRLRQHNGEIVGGARATTSQVKAGERWTRACYVKNFPNWTAALQFEWRWKQLARRRRERAGMVRRRAALEELLTLDRPTSAAVCYNEWGTPPEVVWEDSGDDNISVD